MDQHRQFLERLFRHERKSIQALRRSRAEHSVPADGRTPASEKLINILLNRYAKKMVDIAIARCNNDRLQKFQGIPTNQKFFGISFN